MAVMTRLAVLAIPRANVAKSASARRHSRRLASCVERSHSGIVPSLRWCSRAVAEVVGAAVVAAEEVMAEALAFGQ